MYFVPPHTALRKGLKEGTSTPRLREIYCLDSLSLGSHRRPGQSSQLERQNLPSPLLGRRGGGWGGGDPRVPPPTLTCPGLRQGPAPREASGEAGGRQGGRSAGAREPRRLGRAAGRRASCRGPGNSGAAPTRGSRARLPCVSRAHTHPPRSPRGSSHLRGSPEPRPQRRDGRATRGSRTLWIGPHSPGPWARTTPQHTHTHTGTFVASERDAGQPRTRHTPTRCGSSPAGVPTRTTPPRTFGPLPPHFPGSRAPLPNALDATRRHENTLPHSLPPAQKKQQQPFPRGRGNTHTNTRARARAHPAPTDASPPEPRPQTQTQTPTGGPRSRQPAPKGSRGGGRPGPDPGSRGTGAQSARAWGPPRACAPLLTCIQRAGVRAATAAAAAGRLLLVLRRRGRRRRRWRRGWGQQRHAGSPPRGEAPAGGDAGRAGRAGPPEEPQRRRRGGRLRGARRRRMGGGEGTEGRAAGLRGRWPWTRRRGPAAAAADAKAPARGSCAPAAAEAAAITPRAAQSLALALASWRWGCRRCGGCCCACCCRGRECCTETPAFGASALAHTRSHPRESGERRPRDIGIEINNKVRRVREGGGLIDVEGLARVSHSPARRGGVRGRRRSFSTEPWPRPQGAALGRSARARGAARSLAHFLLYPCCFLTRFSWHEWRAELGRPVGYQKDTAAKPRGVAGRH